MSAAEAARQPPSHPFVQPSVIEDIVNATEMAARDSGGCHAMRELLFSLHNNSKCELGRCMAKLDSSNQRMFLRIFTAAVTDSRFDWEFFGTRMQELAWQTRHIR